MTRTDVIEAVPEFVMADPEAFGRSVARRLIEGVEFMLVVIGPEDARHAWMLREAEAHRHEAEE